MNDSRKLWELGRDSLLRAFISGGEAMEDIVNVISSVGFPIAMSLLLFWYLQKESENHREETNSLRDAITKLEIAITTLVNKLEE